MTTKADWEFRAEYFEDRAKDLDLKAHELLDEAARLRDLAESARKQAAETAQQGKDDGR